MSRIRFDSPHQTSKQRANHRGWGARKPIVFFLGLALGGLLWFAPTIIVNSPLKNSILASATGDFQGEISVGSISAGWFSKLSAKNIVVLDPQGERLIEVESVQLDKNLVALLRDRSHLGTIRVQQPIVNLVLRPDGSNLEDAIAPWLVPSDEPSSIGCDVQIEDGVVQVTDAATGVSWTATQLNVGLGMPLDPAGPLTVHVDSLLNPPDAETAKIVADVLLESGESSGSAGSLTVKAMAVPIELAGSSLHRFLPGAHASGRLEGDVALEWGDHTVSVRITQLAAQGLRVVAPQWLGTDQIELDSFRTSGEVTQRGGAWQVKQLVVQSDVGQLNADGSASITASEEMSFAASTIEALRHGHFRVDGQLNVARLARMLPTTLKVREGTHVSTGEVTIALVSQVDTNGQLWDGRVEAKNLSAMHEGRHLIWEQPIVLTAVARDQNGVITFDTLTCNSSFMSLTASGTSVQGEAKVHGDLSRFAAEASQFVDLGELRLGGRLDGKVNWQQERDQRIRVSASASAEQFEMVSATRPAWREDRLTVQLSGIGGIAEPTTRSIDQCELRVQSGQDQLNLTLFPTPAGTVRETALPVELRLSGEIRNWMARLQPFFVLSGWDLDGTIDLNVGATVATNEVQVDGAHVELGSFRASNGSVFVNEPVLKIDTKGTLNRESFAFVSPDTTIASSSIAMRATNVDVRTGETGIQIAGDIDYRGDVGKLAGIIDDPRQPASRQLSGQATGHIALRHSSQVTSCEWSSDITDFVYAIPTTQAVGQVVTATQTSTNRWNKLWQEPKVKLAATAIYDSANGTVDVSRIEAAGDTISFAARGKLSDLATRCTTELDGQVAYDLQKLSSRFRQQLGDDFQITGRDTRPFSFRGPLFGSSTQANADGLYPVSSGTGVRNEVTSVESALLQMIAQGSLGWSSASVQGVTIGAGDIDAKLSAGKVVFAPIDLTVSEGRVRLAPTVLLDRSPKVVTMQAGPVVERVRISPQMCTSWFKYVAPLVADATAAQGTFSVSLDQAVIPLDNPSAGDVEGVLEIHNAQIGPGPLSQQLLLLAAQIKAIADGNLLGAPTAPAERWLDLPQQRIAFRMAENRVYHEGLQMAVKDVVIRTSGSVGTDQSIALVAEVPVRDEWLSRSQHLASLRGQTIKVPIHGTLTNPKLDQNALAQITQQTVTGAASRYIQGGVNQLDSELNKQLNRGLEKLFGVPR